MKKLPLSLVNRLPIGSSGHEYRLRSVIEFKYRASITSFTVFPLGRIMIGLLPKEKLNRFDKTDQAFLKKFDFSQADINDENLDKLLRTLTKNKDVYSQHKYDVGKIKQKFHVKLLPNSTLTKQRPSKVPLHYQEKLENFLEQLCKTGIVREMGNDKEMGSEFFNGSDVLISCF